MRDILPLVREFKEMNAGNAMVEFSASYGREMVDVLVVTEPPPWTVAEIDNFSEVVTAALYRGILKHMKTRSERRALRRSIVMLQGVALAAALERLRQHSLSGFATGAA